jgi:hypothetical protein
MAQRDSIFQAVWSWVKFSLAYLNPNHHKNCGVARIKFPLTSYQPFDSVLNGMRIPATWARKDNEGEDE